MLAVAVSKKVHELAGGVGDVPCLPGVELP